MKSWIKKWYETIIGVILAIAVVALFNIFVTFPLQKRDTNRQRYVGCVNEQNAAYRYFADHPEDIPARYRDPKDNPFRTVLNYVPKVVPKC